ncbi:UNVERIFIED_ORG: hypothetical protein GGI63_002569 [Rhizobium esperanzae]
MKSDFGESMICRVGGGDGSPQRRSPCEIWRQPMGSKFRESGKNQTLSCFSPAFFVLSNHQYQGEA